jgi:phosphate transport system substrate-binding protein
MMRFVLCLAVVLAGAGCDSRPGASRTITVKGSDTMVLLGQRWAEAYMKHTPGVSVQVTGGGSGTGIAALINGGTDICESSRPMSDKEKKQIRDKHAKDAVETAVALDGLAIYVNEKCPLTRISQEKVKAIYTGKLRNWKELGGDDAEIVAYSRENNSGTYVFFKEHVLGKDDFAANIQTLPGTAAIINAVGKDLRSIGYGGIAYLSGTGAKALPVSKGDADEAVTPSLETVHSGKYPLSRSLFFYTVGEPQAQVKAFVDWVLGEEGQKVCEAVGYYPLKRK